MDGITVGRYKAEEEDPVRESVEFKKDPQGKQQGTRIMAPVSFKLVSQLLQTCNEQTNQKSCKVFEQNRGINKSLEQKIEKRISTCFVTSKKQ